VLGSFSSENDAKNLAMEFQKIVMEKFPFLRAANVKEHNRATERLESKEANSGLSEELLESYHDSFPDFEHYKRISNIMARKGVVYEPEVVPQEVVDTNIEGFRHPEGYVHDPKPTSTDVSAPLASDCDEIELQEEPRLFELEDFPIFGDVVAMEEIPYSDFVYELGFPSGEDVESRTEVYSANVESTVGTFEKNINFPDTNCVDCLKNPSGIRNGSNVSHNKCCDTVQSGKVTSESVSNDSYVFSAYVTAGDSHLKIGSSSLQQEGHNSSSLNNKSATSTLLSLHTLPMNFTKFSITLRFLPLPLPLHFIAYTLLSFTLAALVIVFAFLFYKRKRCSQVRRRVLMRRNRGDEAVYEPFLQDMKISVETEASDPSKLLQHKSRLGVI
jgi:hypothetical protein